MAGGILKGFGGLFLILGIVMLVAGLGAVAYATYDQAQNEDENSAPMIAPDGDPDRAEQNEYILLGGAIAAGLGLILVVISVVLFVGGGARSRNAMMRELKSGQGGGTQLNAKETSPTGAEESSPRAGTIVGIIVGAAAIIVLILLAINFSGGGGNGLFGNGDGEDMTGSSELQGSLGPGLMIPGPVSGIASSTTLELSIPSGSDRVEIVLNWTTSQGVGQLSARLEQETENGWEQVAEVTSAPALEMSAAVDPLLPARLVVYQSEAGPTNGTSIAGSAVYYG